MSNQQRLPLVPILSVRIDSGPASEKTSFKKRADMTTVNPHQLPFDNYDYDEDLKCPVCLEVLACPVARSCGHALCAACHFECAKRTSSRCPICRGGEGAAPLPNKLADAAISLRPARNLRVT